MIHSVMLLPSMTFNILIMLLADYSFTVVRFSVHVNLSLVSDSFISSLIVIWMKTSQKASPILSHTHANVTGNANTHTHTHTHSTFQNRWGFRAKLNDWRHCEASNTHTHTQLVNICCKLELVCIYIQLNMEAKLSHTEIHYQSRIWFTP